jgi:hypothetical protein
VEQRLLGGYHDLVTTLHPNHPPAGLFPSGTLMETCSYCGNRRCGHLRQQHKSNSSANSAPSAFVTGGLQAPPVTPA